MLLGTSNLHRIPHALLTVLSGAMQPVHGVEILLPLLILQLALARCPTCFLSHT